MIRYTVLLVFSMLCTVSANAQKDTFTYVEQMPEYKGSGSIESYLSENLQYPAVSIEANESGTVYVKLTIAADGRVNNAAVSVSSGYTALDKEALRVCRTLPAFRPGKQNGKAVPVYYTIPVRFVLEGDIDGDPAPIAPPPPVYDDVVAEPYEADSVMMVPPTIENTYDSDYETAVEDYSSDVVAAPSEDYGYNSRNYIQEKNIKDLKIEARPDKRASYYDGMTELFKAVNRLVQYPYSYYGGERPKGYVIIKFVVGADSVIYNAEVIKSMGSKYDQNALNVLNEMRFDWLPATKKGKPVSSYFYLPVRFEYKKQSWEY